MDNQTKEIIKKYIAKARATQTPYTALLGTDENNTINVLVTTDKFLMYHTSETDSGLKDDAYSVVEYDEDGMQNSNKSGWLKYSWIDEELVPHFEKMTIDEKVEFDLAELLDDTSKSDIYAIVKESEERKKELNRKQHAKAQARYRQKNKDNPDFKAKNAKSTLRYSAKVFINEYAELHELITLEKLILKRKQELKKIDE